MTGWDELKQKWLTLIADVEKVSAAQPSDCVMQELASRWERLMALSTDGAPYARDLARHAEVLQTGGASRPVPGGLAFEKIGPALGSRFAFAASRPAR